MKCNEAPEETPTVSEERLLQLSCFINQGKFFFQYEFLSQQIPFSFRCEISPDWFKECL